MAGEERLRWLLDLNIDGSQVLRFIDEAEARLARLAAQTGRVRGPGGRAGAFGREQAEIEAVRARLPTGLPATERARLQRLYEQAKTGAAGASTRQAAGGEEQRAQRARAIADEQAGAKDRRAAEQRLAKQAERTAVDREQQEVLLKKAEVDRRRAIEASATAERRLLGERSAAQAAVLRSLRRQGQVAVPPTPPRAGLSPIELRELRQRQLPKVTDRNQALEDYRRVQQRRADPALADPKLADAQLKQFRREQKAAEDSAKAVARARDEQLKRTPVLGPDPAIERAAIARREKEQRDSERAARDAERRQKTERYTTARVALGQPIETLSKERAKVLRETIEAEAQSRFAERNMTKAIAQRESALRKAAYEQQLRTGAGKEVTGTAFQRVQSRLASRDGSFRDPTEFQTGGQFLKSRFLTTAGFAVSGLATYGLFQGLANAVKEATELERALALIEAQLNAIDQSAEFPEFRSGILDIASSTGQAADEVANIAFQLRGAFRGDTTQQVLRQTESAVKVARLTGLALNEINDSLTATALVFRDELGSDPIGAIGDAVLALQEQTGVLAKETISFVADLAPVAHEVGLTFKEIAAFGAVAQQQSGRSGTALAEGLNRVLPALQENATEVVALFQQVAPEKLQGVITAISQGETGTIFKALGESFDKLSDTQKNFVVSLIGGRREAQNVIPILSNYAEVQRLVNVEEKSRGKTDEYFARVQKTLSESGARLTQAFRRLGEAILRSGITDAVQDIISALTSLTTVAAQVLGVFADLNEAAGGLPVKLALAIASAAALAKVFSTLGAAGVFGGGAGAGGKAGLFGGVLALGGNLLSSTRGSFAAARQQQTSVVGGRLQVGSQAGARFQSNLGGAIGTVAGGGGAKAGLAALGGGSLAAGAATAGVLVGVTALTTYLSARGQLNESADKKLEELKKLDKEELGRLASQEEDNITKFGKFIFGNKTDPELAKDALQIKEAEERLIPRINDIITALGERSEANADAIDFLNGIQRDLESHPEDNDINARARFVTNELKQLEKIPKNVASPLAKIIDDLPDDFGEDTNIASFTTGMDQIIGDFEEQIDNFKKAQDIIDAAGGQAGITGPSDKAKEARKKITELTGIEHPTEATVDTGLEDLKSLQTEFQEKGTIAGFPLDQLPELAEILGETGAGLIGILADVAKANKETQAVQDARKGLERFSVTEAKFNAGVVSDAAYTEALHKAVEDSKLIVDSFLDQKEVDDAELKKALDQYAENKQKESQRLSQSLQARVDTARQFADIGGLDTAGIELATQAQLSAALDNPDVAFEDRKKFADDYLASQQALLEFQAENADSEEETIRILEEGLDIPINVQAVLIEEMLRNLSDEQKALFEQLAQDVGLTYDQFIAMAAQAQATGQDFLVALIADIDKKLANLKKAARGGDDVSAETKRLNEAKAEAQALQASGDLEVDSPEQVKADADAKKAKEDYREKIALAKNAISKSLTRDPVRLAQLDIEAANIKIKYAKEKGGEEGELAELAAIAERNQAQQALVDANNAISSAQLDVAKATAERGGDTLAIAQIGLREADLAAQQAYGAAAQLQAQAQRIRAEDQMRDAINAIFDATSEFTIAVAEAAGNTVLVADLRIQLLQQQIQRLRATGANEANNPDLIRLNSELVSAQAAARDERLNRSIEDIEFDLDMEKISNGQAIQRLENLLAAGNLTEGQRRDLQRRIKQLKDEIAGGDLQFNIPDVVLPTLTEVRRLTQAGSASAFGGQLIGGSALNDNRVIYININNLQNADAQAIAAAISTQLSQPPTYGVRGRLY